MDLPLTSPADQSVRRPRQSLLVGTDTTAGVKLVSITLIHLSVIHAAIAGTVRVTVGDTGCPGRQIGVTRSWEKIPGVISVTVLARDPKDPAAQRVFVIVSKAAPPTEDSLREALGRRAERYPILKYVGEPAGHKE